MAINDYLTGINRATSGQTEDVKTATADLTSAQVGAGSLPAKLKEALNTKLNNNRDIIEQQSSTMENYFNSGAVAREKYKDVWNPFEKAKLVQQERSMALRPYDTLSGVLENRMGTVNDIVKSGIEGWQGVVNAATTKLGTAKDMLATALQSYLKAADMQQAADDMAFKIAQAKEASRQFELNYGLDVTKVNNQVDQFNKELALKTKQLSMSGGGSNSEAAKKAKLTADVWADVLDKSGGDPSKAWQMIHNNEAAWGGAGVDMNTIWAGYKAIGGSSTPPAASAPPESFLSRIFGGGTPAPSKMTPYGQAVIDAAALKKAGVLQPGDPNYVDFSKTNYLQGYK